MREDRRGRERPVLRYRTTLASEPRLPAVSRAAALGARALERFREVEGVQAATLLAAQAFTSLVPMLVVVAALSPAEGDLGDRLVDRFDLEGAPAENVQALFNDSGEVTGAVTWVGIVILILSALGFTRAVQRLFECAYRAQMPRVEAAWRGLAWLLACAAWVALLAPLRDALADLGGIGFSVAAATASGFAVWLGTPLILLGEEDWRRLAPGAAVSALIGGLASVASAIWLPTLLSWSAERYGLIGIAFSLQSMLLVMAFAVVIGAVAGATLTETAEERGRVGSPPP
jgi:membrane protein